jgi:excisionase family DNA binding protein
MNDELLTIPHVAQRLGVSPQRAYELARLRLIPTVRLGRQLRVDPGRLEEFIQGGGSSQPIKESGDE